MVGPPGLRNEEFSLSETPVTIRKVFPSMLLERRPDIAAAERQMQEENELIGVAKAAYYPDVTLSSLVGFSSNMFTQLFTVANEAWSLSAAATETVFDAGERAAAVRGAEATYDQSVANYRQTVLAAFQLGHSQIIKIVGWQRQRTRAFLKELNRVGKLLTLEVYLGENSSEFGIGREGLPSFHR